MNTTQRLAKRGRRLPPQLRRERLYMRKIERIERQARPNICWPDLVMWLWDEEQRRFWRRRRPYPLPALTYNDGPPSCKADAVLCGWCWCGKFITQQTADDWRDHGGNPTHNSIIVEATQ